MSYKVEVIADGSGKWCSNQLRFATKKEADAAALDLAMRWTLVRDWRSAECDEPVNAQIVDGKLTHLEPAEQPADQPGAVR